MYCIDAWKTVRPVGDDYVAVAGETLYTELPESVRQGLFEIQAKAEILAEAQESLVRSDIQVLRCFEDGIPLPAEWVAYRRRLREIGSGKSAGPVPVRPEWP